MIGLRSMSEGPDVGSVKGIIQDTIQKLSLPSHDGYGYFNYAIVYGRGPSNYIQL